MPDTNQPILWVVDENKGELGTYQQLLALTLNDTGGVAVRAVQAYPHKDDYLPLVQDAQTAGFVVDYKLKETGIADYDGLELANYLRALDSKLPIYILTNYPEEIDEFGDDAWSVEDILDKDDMDQAERRQVIAARILRRINVYRDILGQRETRFRELLKKSLQADLDESEQHELEELEFGRAATTMAAELPQVKQLRELIRTQEELSAVLKRRLREADDATE